MFIRVYSTMGIRLSAKQVPPLHRKPSWHSHPSDSQVSLKFWVTHLPLRQTVEACGQVSFLSSQLFSGRQVPPPLHLPSLPLDILHLRKREPSPQPASSAWAGRGHQDGQESNAGQKKESKASHYKG